MLLRYLQEVEGSSHKLPGGNTGQGGAGPADLWNIIEQLGPSNFDLLNNQGGQWDPMLNSNPTFEPVNSGGGNPIFDWAQKAVQGYMLLRYLQEVEGSSHKLFLHFVQQEMIDCL
jgi:hypothetical protein